jgi:uncharacterized protein
MKTAPDLTDRLTIRERPAGPPMLHQSWDKLLFLHWQVPVDELRSLVPGSLAIDTFHGSAWVGITPFTIYGSRPVFTPPMPWLSAFHEVNVRTYVHRDGVPGVWFLSLDASSLPAVLAGRAVYRLPYFQAEIALEGEGRNIRCTAARKNCEPPAELTASWSTGAEEQQAEPGSLEFFLVERYCLYAADARKLYRARIHHEPWPLWPVTLATYATSLLTATGLPAAGGKPRVHAGGPVHVDIWPLEEVGPALPSPSRVA